MNSRTSGLIDFDCNSGNVDEINILQGITDANDLIEKEDLVFNDMSIERVHTDKGVNEHGHILVRLCKMAGMIILNGRCKEDKDKGKLTFCNKRGNKLLKVQLIMFYVPKIFLIMYLVLVYMNVIYFQIMLFWTLFEV